ncbi:transposase, partial [Pluralibacter gergoviae]|nr:transposase [Pluralibacter gergoviae]
MSNHDDSLEGSLRKRHSVSKLVVHLIFTTKYRRKLFDGQMIAQLRDAFGSAAAKL